MWDKSDVTMSGCELQILIDFPINKTQRKLSIPLWKIYYSD